MARLFAPAAADAISETLLSQVRQAELHRLAKFEQAWRYYLGDHDTPLKRKPTDPDDNVRVNLARVIVDKGVSYLFGKGGVQISAEAAVGDEQEAPDAAVDSPTEEAWQAALKASSPQLLQKTGQNGAVTGQVFWRLVSDQPGSVRILNLDPAGMSPIWDPDDYETILEWQQTWSTIVLDAQGRPKPVVRRRRDEQQESGEWLTHLEQAEGHANRWEPYAEPEPWPFEFAPILSTQNLPMANEFWGLSDIEYDVLHLNDVVNAVASNLRKIVRHHGTPTLVASGMGDGAGIKLTDEGVLLLPDSDSKLTAIELLSNIGGVIEYLDKIQDALMEVARTPASGVDKLGNVGNLSGRALRIMYEPLIEKTETKHETYGEFLEDAVERVARVTGIEDPEDPQIVWPDPLPTDEMEERQVAIADQTLGVSNETLLERLGYDPATEMERQAAEAEARAERARRSFDRGESTGFGDDDEGDDEGA